MSMVTVGGILYQQKLQEPLFMLFFIRQRLCQHYRLLSLYLHSKLIVLESGILKHAALFWMGSLLNWKEHGFVWWCFGSLIGTAAWQCQLVCLYANYSICSTL